MESKKETCRPLCLSCGSSDLKHWAQARDLEYFTTAEEFAYFRCEGCQSLSISPVPVERLGQIYPPDYYAFESPKPSLLGRLKNFLDSRRLRALLRQIPGQDLRVLDVGGGSGWMLSLIKESDKRVSSGTVVDIDTVATERARAAGHEAFCGPLQAFRGKGPFDLILMLNLIEHVADPEQLLLQAKRLLAPHGIILLKTPNFECWEAKAFRHANWGAYHCPRHWVLFTPSSLKELLNRQSLHLQSLECTQGATFWASTVLMSLHRRGWLKLSAELPLQKRATYPWLCALFALIDSVRTIFVPTSQMFAVVHHR